MKASEKLNSVFEQSYLNQGMNKTETEIMEYRAALNKMKQLGFKTLEEYFEYLNYMKSKGFDVKI